jgi:tetratricopeptide (TPR) repeat protein
VRKKEEFLKKIDEAKGASEMENIITEINQWLEKEPGDIALLEQRALLFEKLRQYGKAINDYNKILEADPGHKQAQTKKELLSTILRYSNTDIYASTNTNMDPWFE